MPLSPLGQGASARQTPNLVLRVRLLTPEVDTKHPQRREERVVIVVPLVLLCLASHPATSSHFVAIVQIRGTDTFAHVTVGLR